MGENLWRQSGGFHEYKRQDQAKKQIIKESNQELLSKTEK